MDEGVDEAWGAYVAVSIFVGPGAGCACRGILFMCWVRVQSGACFAPQRIGVLSASVQFAGAEGFGGVDPYSDCLVGYVSVNDRAVWGVYGECVGHQPEGLFCCGMLGDFVVICGSACVYQCWDDGEGVDERGP